jgi:hypothetical protein
MHQSLNDLIAIKILADFGYLVNALWYYCPHTLLNYLALQSFDFGFAPGFAIYKKGALDSQPQVIKFTSFLPMVGGSLRVLWLLQQEWLIYTNVNRSG